MEYFAQLGATIETQWGARGRREEDLPDVAVAALREAPVHEALSRSALLDHLLDPRRGSPSQLAPPHAFGQPGFTMHSGRGFVIELYHWLDSISAVHNHPFCGAFTIVHGTSVHARYRVDHRRCLSGRTFAAHSELCGLDLLTTGAVVPFSLERHPLVHALIHVPRGAISMVVRTIRTEGYFRYLPPSLALPMEDEGEPLGRQLALLDALTSAGDPEAAARVEAMLERADFELALRVLSSHWARWSVDEREATLASLRVRLGDDVSLLRPALDNATRLSQATAIRQSLHDPQLRLVAIALGYAERRDQILDLLAAHTETPLDLLRRFIAEADLFDPGEEASAIIAGALIDGTGAEGAIAALRDHYGAEAIAEHEADVRDFCATSIFSALARA